ncbi:hypothetical protein [Sphingomonas sp. LM7]|uniref:hypothetical protein n=1 Tax=Sphingomonas sp. LM7 TaxID=1938607 RepID=UPI0009876786|nr:hypothetical protein [Sphingomonas sp. LM7]
MLALLLLATDPETTAVDAEEAFRRAAQAEGQWTAFRKFATDDAILFLPQPEKVQKALPDKNPPVAVQWWPAQSYVSCDGTTAINTGPWILPKSAGYFTTVWRKQPQGAWKWELDHGDTLAKPRAVPAKAETVKASCAPISEPTATPMAPLGDKAGDGQSPDGTLLWHWEVSAAGARSFDAWIWDGRTFVSAVSNKVAAPR